jgi:hypothetical protein
MDTRMATMKEPLVHNPLEKNLGFVEFGRFAKANPQSDHAYEKIVTMWNEEVENSSSDDDDDDEALVLDSLEPGATEVDNGEQKDEMTETKTLDQEAATKRGRSQGQFPIWRPTSTRQRLDELWRSMGNQKTNCASSGKQSRKESTMHTTW